MSATCNDVNIFSKFNIKYIYMYITLNQDMAGTSMGTSVMLRSNFYTEKRPFLTLGELTVISYKKCYGLGIAASGSTPTEP